MTDYPYCNSAFSVSRSIWPGHIEIMCDLGPARVCRPVSGSLYRNTYWHEDGDLRWCSRDEEENGRAVIALVIEQALNSIWYGPRAYIKWRISRITMKWYAKIVLDGFRTRFASGDIWELAETLQPPYWGGWAKGVEEVSWKSSIPAVLDFDKDKHADIPMPAWNPPGFQIPCWLDPDKYRRFAPIKGTRLVWGGYAHTNEFVYWESGTTAPMEIPAKQVADAGFTGTFHELVSELEKHEADSGTACRWIRAVRTAKERWHSGAGVSGKYDLEKALAILTTE